MSTDVSILKIPRNDGPSEAEQLGAEITELWSYISAAEYRFLSLVGEFDEKRYWGELGICSCAHWLNFKCGIGMNAARERVRVARALPALPKISEAFRRGKISYSKVRAMTRVADERNEDYLMMIAKHGTAHHVERLVSKYRRAKKQIDAQNAGEQHRQRELTHYYDHDGCLVIRARVPAEQGELIVKALEMALDKAFNNGDEEREHIAARRADALADIAQTYLNHNEETGTTADRYQVVVHVYPEGTRTADQVPSGQTPHSDDCRHVTAESPHIENGPHVTAETSRRVACDCSTVAIKESDTGEPLSIGRRSRSIPPAIRRALRLRDKGCRFPGCTNTRYVDGHHIIHWADGGETSLDNLVLLCKHHHRLVHEGGFSCEKDKDGEIVFRDRRSQRLKELTALPGVPSIEDYHRWFDREFFEADINSNTCIPKWYAGDRMGWDLAVANMFQ